MRLTASQVDNFREDGYLLLENVFTTAEVDVLNAEVASISAVDAPERVMEKDGVHVRTVFGSHERSVILHNLSRHPRLLAPLGQLIDGSLYIHQFKINAKTAFAGDLWQWHQDYIYWLREDGMMKPEAITAAVFLDDVTEFNGPLLIVPRSHKLGVINIEARDTAPTWRATVIADLKYMLGPDSMRDLVRREGIVAPKGRRGAVLLFHCNTVHGSTPNMSPVDRKVAFISYNPVDNALEERPEPRPSFMASRKYEPVTPVADNVLCVAGGGCPAGC